MINLTCPECGKELNIVPSSKCLNPEQYDSVKAGDYFCKNCKGNRGNTGYRYYWKEEINNSQNSNERNILQLILMILKESNPFCAACKENDCVISHDGTCAMIRVYREYLLKKGSV